MRLAEMSLLVSAEDDAIMSHSTVSFPVQSYLDRISRLSDDFDKQRLQPLQINHDSLSSEAVVEALESFLYQDLKIQCAPFGRSNLPPNSLIDHPGVYEDPRWAYLDQLLIRKKGHKSCVAILISEIVRLLLQKGRIDFAITVDLSTSSTRPRVSVLPAATRGPLVSLDVLNTCSSDTLRESLAHLKRSYWPLQWDTTQPTTEDSSPSQFGFDSHGGFLTGAKAALGEAMSAQLRAISTVANWRLERGIWTSPGAGDSRRCRSSCERLLMLSESLRDVRECDLERRDLAVLLLMSGVLDQAFVELEAFESSSTFLQSDAVEQILVKRMLDSLVSVNVVRGGTPISLASTLSGPPPSLWAPAPTKRPLTW